MSAENGFPQGFQLAMQPYHTLRAESSLFQ